MDNPRPEKVAVVDEVRERLADADAVILTEYRGLKVKELATLRRSLTPAGGDYKVYKNTLVRFAARDAGLELDELLAGPTGVAFVKGDAAAVAKALREFSRSQPLLVIKGGVLGQKILTAPETTALADLPSREVLLARLAGGLAAPLQQLAGLLQAMPRNLAYGISALRDQKAAAEPAPADAAPQDAAPEGAVPAAADDAAAPAADAASAADAAPAEAATQEPEDATPAPETA